MKARIILGDCRESLSKLSDQSVRCVVTSPPYWGLRDYGHDGQMGLEKSVDEYVAGMVEVFREVRRVLSDDGTLWLNLGDTYSTGSGGGRGAGAKQRSSVGSLMPRAPSADVPTKNILGVPWRVAFALQDDGWILRQDIIWAKPNPMPESVKDRCTKSHEYLFLLSKRARYYFASEAMQEPAVATNFEDSSNGSRFDQGKTAGHHDKPAKPPRFGGKKYGDSDDPMHATKSGNEYQFTGTRNKRDVWTIPTQPFKGAHFAVIPEALVTPCVLAGSAEGDTILDPFSGSGTVGVVALRHGRNYVGLELNKEYADMSVERISQDAPLLNEVTLGITDKEEAQ